MAQDEHSVAAHAAAVTSDPRCPRCGYDQRGTISNWNENCPLKGVCTECGLEFQWRDVLMLSWGEPPWCVEYGAQREIPSRALLTLLLTFRPWKMWSQLRMHHAISPGRVGTYVLILLATGYVMLALGAGIWAWSYVSGYGGQITPHVTPAPAALRALAFPFSTEPLGTYSVPTRGGRFPMASPDSMTWSILTPSLRSAAPVALLQAIAALAFLALPISRRRAKVKWRHIVRVCVYGLPLAGAMWFIAFLTFWTGYIDAGGGPGSIVRQANDVLATIFPFALLAMVPAHVVWWSLATSRYLKMTHAWGVGFAVVLIGTLAAVVVFAAMGWL